MATSHAPVRPVPSAALALVAAASLVALAGCVDDARPFGFSSARTDGPDAVTGAGPTLNVIGGAPAAAGAGEKLPDDSVTGNGAIVVAVEAVGLDPSTATLQVGARQGVPHQGGPFEGGGHLTDIALAGRANDQFVSSALAVIGRSANGVAFGAHDNVVFWCDVIPDTDPAAAAYGLSIGVQRGIAVVGVVINRTQRTGSGAALSGATTESAATIRASAAAGLLPRGFATRVPDAYPVLVHTTGGGATSTHVPVVVVQVHSLPGTSLLLNTTTTLRNGVPDADPLGVRRLADLVYVGEGEGRNLDPLPAGPIFTAVPGGLSAAFGGRASVQTAEFNANAQAIAAGATLTADSFGAGVVPWVALVGRDDEAISYAVTDAAAGGVYYERSASRAGTVVLAQIGGVPDLPADLSGTAVDEAVVGRLEWRRSIAVGDRGDGAAAGDLGAIALRSFNEADRAPSHGFGATAVVSGRLLSAPPGTVITIAERAPTFFSTFDPRVEAPTVGGAARFFGPGLAAATETAALTLTADVLRTTIRPNADGTFAATLPVGFAATNVTTGAVIAAESAFVVRALVPGLAQPIELGAPRIAAGPAARADLGALDVQSVAPLGAIAFEIRDGAGQPTPGRLTILAQDGSVPAGLFLPGAALDGRLARASLAGNSIYTASGAGRVLLPAGLYQLVATAGPEWSHAEEMVDVPAGGTPTAVTLEIEHVTNVPRRALAVDTHAHTGLSRNSGLPAADRIRAALAEGVDVLVVTETDRIGDLTAALKAVATERPDLAARLRVVAGSELAQTLPWIDGTALSLAPQTTIGRFAGFPLPFQAGIRNGGAPPDELRKPVDAYLLLRLLDGTLDDAQPIPETGELIQLNAPRDRAPPGDGHETGGLIANLADALGPNFAGAATPITREGIQLLVDDQAAGPFAPEMSARFRGTAGFDTIELLSAASGTEAYLRARADWFALLNRGVIKTATGGSGSLGLGGRSGGGVPRTVVLAAGTPSSVGEAALVTSLKPTFATPAATGAATLAPAPYLGDRMKSFVTNGPYLEVAFLYGATQVADPIGRLLHIPSTVTDTVQINVAARGPSWVLEPVNQVRFIINGQRVASAMPSVAQPVAGSADLVRRADVNLPFAALGNVAADDFWIVIEAGSELGNQTGQFTPPAPDSTYGRVYPGMPVIAFTNPIFVNRLTGAGESEPPARGAGSFDPAGN